MRKRSSLRRILKKNIRQMRAIPEKLSNKKGKSDDKRKDKIPFNISEWLHDSRGPVYTSWVKWAETGKSLGQWKCPPLNTLLDLKDFLAVLDDSGILEITLGEEFDEEIPPGILPKKLSRITFGKKFNQRILPGTIDAEVLIFGDSFNKAFEENTFGDTTRFIYLPNTYSQLLSSNIFTKGRKGKVFKGNELQTIS